MIATVRALLIHEIFIYLGTLIDIIFYSAFNLTVLTEASRYDEEKITNQEKKIKYKWGHKFLLTWVLSFCKYRANLTD